MYDKYPLISMKKCIYFFYLAHFRNLGRSYEKGFICFVGYLRFSDLYLLIVFRKSLLFTILNFDRFF